MVIQQDKMQSLATRMSQDEVKGRSPWADARKRFLRNKAAMTGLIILIGVALFALLGNQFAQWSNEDLDFTVMGQVATMGMPSFENGHYFGTDDLGRDLFARTVQGTQIFSQELSGRGPALDDQALILTPGPHVERGVEQAKERHHEDRGQTR